MNPGMRLTQDGLNVLAKGLIGKNIHFTKGQLGDGDFDYTSETVVAMTALKSPKLDMPIVGKELAGGVAVIKTNINNATLANGFRAKEHGIFALDPDTGQEILYAYRNAGDDYSFIPGANGIIPVNVTKAYFIEISDATNVTFNIDWSFAYVSQQDFQDLKDRFIPIYNDYMTPNQNVIAQILNNTYTPSGDTTSDNGVPTADEIAAILADTYIHTEIQPDPVYAIYVPTTTDIDNILGS